jgi:hypothetical protein
MADLANAYVSWRQGWLSETRATFYSAFRGPPLTEGQVTFEWCRSALDSAYVALSYVLHQTPKFVVTNVAACEADDKTTTVGLTTWACTQTAQRITDPDKFVHSATFDKKPERAERENMWKLASRVDNDWIVVPLVALFLRLAMQDASVPLDDPERTVDAKAFAVFETEVDLTGSLEQLQCMAEHGGHIGLVEIDTPQLPTLQFAAAKGQEADGPRFLSMTRHDRMNALRVGSKMMDPVHCRDLVGKRRLTLLDVELTAFLVWHWYKTQGFQEDFEQVVAAYALDFAAAAQRAAADTRDLDELVASINAPAGLGGAGK